MTEEIAWESTTICFTKFITDEKYQNLNPDSQGWYQPYRCSACADTADAIETLTRERDEAREALKLVREWFDHISDDDNIVDAADEADKMADVQIAVDAALSKGKPE